ncbi:MAG TPA: sodium:proton antiporter [Deltaproteobacteria bacterium]|nr:MAG: sodium:proton antiporter [Deltaproteobacteria bacterium GWA2_55_82]OGQ62103.1 MAG: sodium:proton antiporter [Deltaproteobacteria bacterium RIFCSPLOWO2_02_FULL_55_12]OIJ74038.1 MAG: sodium:proton antiporter [Deltaproteobacteria bacterium GWC2_55_46]HBG46646.1 sodium:proton antiporter [Deltaproteobacteria bacterium]HCY11346.1 sodium:proton antiporter [Deltaproteobacteria bacterium]
MHALTSSWLGYLSLGAFVLAYVLVILEEKLHLRKSKPVLLIGCLMWAFIALYESVNGAGHAEEHVKHMIGEIAELFFFILVAMTYINTLQERMVFDSLKSWLIRKGFGYRSLFWITGVITFFLSAVADNLTSALLMATVVAAVSSNRAFIVPAFINIIVSANAGGAWSPFGDITTLMVWTTGRVETLQFSAIVIPSVVNWFVPAAIMFPFLPKGAPQGSSERIMMKRGAKSVIVLGFLTIATAVSFHQFLHLPPFLGMMTGLGLLMFLGYYIKKKDGFRNKAQDIEESFNIFRKIERSEFDTLLFFFGIITAVGALQYIGYLSLLSANLYGVFGPSYANIAVGVISAVVDNIPVMYAVLQMNPEMGLDQWLLVTLTAGTGGSLLSIGSAAGVAVMGVRRDMYTFLSHLKWTPVIALGYAASIAAWWVFVKV